MQVRDTMCKIEDATPIIEKFFCSNNNLISLYLSVQDEMWRCDPDLLFCYKNGLIGEVLNVVTLEPYKRQGVASELMKMLMEEGRRRNLDFIFLEATEEGVLLYEKLGWERSAAYTPMQYVYG